MAKNNVRNLAWATAVERFTAALASEKATGRLLGAALATSPGAARGNRNAATKLVKTRTLLLLSESSSNTEIAPFVAKAREFLRVFGLCSIDRTQLVKYRQPEAPEFRKKPRQRFRLDV